MVKKQAIKNPQKGKQMKKVKQNNKTKIKLMMLRILTVVINMFVLCPTDSTMIVLAFTLQIILGFTLWYSY